MAKFIARRGDTRWVAFDGALLLRGVYAVRVHRVIGMDLLGMGRGHSLRIFEGGDDQHTTIKKC